MDRIKGKVALITGAAGGIGAASAKLFATEGASVVLVDRDVEAGRKLESEIAGTGAPALFVETDVRQEDSVAAAVAAALARFGQLDILFNVAGGSAATDAPAHEVDMTLWERTLSVDLLGTFLFCRHAVRPMMAAKRGAIVNTSSWAGLKGFRKHIYSSAKGGVIALTRSLAGDYARYGVRANVICPGGIRSERNLSRYSHLSDDDPVARDRKRLLETHPFFFGDPVDIAYIALFLGSDESRMITGATLAADGGRSAY